MPRVGWGKLSCITSKLVFHSLGQTWKHIQQHLTFVRTVQRHAVPSSLWWGLWIKPHKLSNESRSKPRKLLLPSKYSLSPTPVAPEAPTNVYGEQAGLRTARVYWAAPDDNGSTITTYEVTYSRAGVDEGVMSATGSPAPTFVDIEDLLTGSSYTFAVQAINSGGGSAPSETSVQVSHHDI